MSSPYHQLLGFESYTIIASEHLDFLNAHWRKRFYVYLAMAQLIAGAILVDGNGAILLNGTESYCQYSSIDVHYEKLFTMQELSFPDRMSQHPNPLKITMIFTDNSENCIRIDDETISPKVGPYTKNFNVSKNTKIFLCIGSIEHMNKILNAPDHMRLLSVGIDPLMHLCTRENPTDPFEGDILMEMTLISSIHIHLSKSSDNSKIWTDQ
ncbi:hypothetical protein AB4K20DRAFT_1871241 [Rhizopus microsporus]